MKVVFNHQGILEMIKNGVDPICDDANDRQKVGHKEAMTKYFKAL